MTEFTVDMEKALELPISTPDLEGEITLRMFLAELLHTVWKQTRDFNGMQPLGSTGWQKPVYLALLEGGFLAGKIVRSYDPAGSDISTLFNLQLVEFDYVRADAFIHECIGHMTGTL